MKDFKGKIQYKGRIYDLVFDLNVLEQIQDEYGSVEKWGELTDGREVVKDEHGEPVFDENDEPKIRQKEVDAKALKFGFWCMLNEGIDICNEDNGTELSHVTKNQVGRMITEYGLEEAANTVHETVINSAGSDEKNV